MLDGQGRQMRVGHQAGSRLRQIEERTQGFPMSRCGNRNPSRSGLQPILDLPPSVAHAHRPLHDTRIRNDPDEGQQRRPRQPDSSKLFELTIQPRVCLAVLRHLPDVRVDEQVGVEEDHR